MPGRKTTSDDSFLQNGAAHDAKRNSKGEIISWKADSQDGKELKAYFEAGACKGLTPMQSRLKFPQFNKYSYSTYSSAFNNAKKAFNNQIKDRGVKNARQIINLLI